MSGEQIMESHKLHHKLETKAALHKLHLQGLVTLESGTVPNGTVLNQGGKTCPLPQIEDR